MKLCLKTDNNKEIPPLLFKGEEMLSVWLFNITITPGSSSDQLEAQEGSSLVKNYIHMWVSGPRSHYAHKGPQEGAYLSWPWHS